MSYLYETHLHTCEGSAYARTPAREYVPYYLDQGYRGIVVTDHFYRSVCYVPDPAAPWKEQVDEYCRGYEEALDEGLKRGLDVFFGMEFSFGTDECLVYGLDKAWLYARPDVRNWSRKKLFEETDAAGGCLVHAHPFRAWNSGDRAWVNGCVHGIEGMNGGNTPRANAFAFALARRLGLPATAGSDMHQIGTRRPCGVRFEKPWNSVADYARAVRGKTPFSLQEPTETLPEERPGPCAFVTGDGRTLLWEPSPEREKGGRKGK